MERTFSIVAEYIIISRLLRIIDIDMERVCRALGMGKVESKLFLFLKESMGDYLGSSHGHFRTRYSQTAR